jgi:hypothetical protein
MIPSIKNEHLSTSRCEISEETCVISRMQSYDDNDDDNNNNKKKNMVEYWLRHYATSRKVAGSRSDEVNEFFQFI